MTFRSNLAKSALAGVAGVMALSAALAVPSFAAAQPGYYGGGSYDPCRREATGRGTMGGLLGGAIGAAIGANAAAKNARTEGALLGGALGAAVGAGVGNKSAACSDGYRSQSYYRSGYRDYGYNNRSDYYTDRYRDGRYGGDRYYDDGYAQRSSNYGYAYDRRGGRYNVAQRPGADGCTLAEAPIYLPDGRTQNRFVRVCMDSNGEYQVVD